jgi:hypothetical protein
MKRLILIAATIVLTGCAAGHAYTGIEGGPTSVSTH